MSISLRDPYIAPKESAVFNDVDFVDNNIRPVSGYYEIEFDRRGRPREMKIIHPSPYIVP